MSNDDEIQCLRCGQDLYYINYRVKCENCLFYNDVMPEETLKKLQEDTKSYDIEFDPIFLISKKIDTAFSQYAYPSITKHEFQTLSEKAPLTGEAFLKYLKQGRGSLTSEEDTRLRVLKSEHNIEKLEEQIKYLQAKLEVVKYIEKTKL